MGQAGAVGTGGLSHGPGEAAFLWGTEDPLRGELFDARALPSPGVGFDPASLGTLGVSALAPRTEALHEAAGDSNLAPALGASPWRRRLAPRHRRAVRTLLGPAGVFSAGPSAGRTQGAATPTTKEEQR